MELGWHLRQNWKKWEHLKFFGDVAYSGACLNMQLQSSPIYSHSCFPYILGRRGLVDGIIYSVIIFLLCLLPFKIVFVFIFVRKQCIRKKPSFAIPM